MEKKILVVDDEETLCEALRFNLEAEGYNVDTAFSAEEALTLELNSYNLIMLDVMMGEMSGTQLARLLKSRPETSAIPIIFLTAKDSVDDMVGGLELGADDYIIKPFTIRNVLARVKAVLRRASTPAKHPENSDLVVYGDLVIDVQRKSCSLEGNPIKMPRKEFEILHKLLSNPGRVFSREEILHEIWPEEVVVLDRVVDVNITRIRQKIGKYGKCIVTRSGYGYGFFGE